MWSIHEHLDRGFAGLETQAHLVVDFQHPPLLIVLPKLACGVRDFR